MLRRRSRAWKHYRTSNSGYDEYRLVRNQCSAAKVAKRRIFEERLAAESATVPRRLVAYLKRRTRTVPGLPSLVENGVTADTDVDKAGVLAGHYASVYTGADIWNSPPSPPHQVVFAPS
ncbi:unnamed protein product [Echinostoma caproni]|uniref:Uncharacterized protein n=1 Tax=Echinostoma caproni TaxID=27848 RepID=A0A183BEZ2_9TREM|nr:unnamed protein product [Echinostoma caproni]